MGHSATAGGRYLHGILAVAATIWLLIVARDVLLPFVLALFVWFVLGAVANVYGRALARIGLRAPTLAGVAAGVTILVALVGFSLLLVSSAAALAASLPRYEQRLDAILAGVATSVGVDAAFQVSDLVARIDITRTMIGVAGSAAGALSALIILLAYIYFINKEARAVEGKLAALIAEPGQRAEVAALMTGVLHEVERYMGVRVILGVVQALPTYAVLALVGVDAPAFWAVTVFCASFVPTVGTLIGITFPALMARVQFDTLGPFAAVVASLVPVQLVASNLLEPALLSRSLNISPLAVFLGIFAGGAVWGIVGALIVVPVMAVCVIIFARSPSMRPVAILLSADGRIAPARGSG